MKETRRHLEEQRAEWMAEGLEPVSAEPSVKGRANLFMEALFVGGVVIAFVVGLLVVLA